LYKDKLLLIWKAVLKDLENLLAISFGCKKTTTGKSSQDTKSYTWFKGKRWPANITLQYQQLKIEVLSLSSTEKIIYASIRLHKDYAYLYTKDSLY